MFVTIITIILLIIDFTLWAIIYGGSQNISGVEHIKHEKKLNEKLLRKTNRKKLINKMRWILWH